ncbi:MAG: alpha/beta hydrolase [Deltaproteobacteria bacterium]|nr:alpha/beta hydrolase [Deltaproteobacteria bacterium]
MPDAASPAEALAVATGPARPVTVRGSQLPQRDVTVGGLRVRIADTGPSTKSDATRTLVILPGHTSRLEGYDSLVRHLLQRHRVLTLDFPGTGYSDKPVRSYSLRFYEDTLIDLLNALSIDEAVLVGGSLGGNLVLRLGHRFPQRFPLLVSWAPASAWRARPRLAAWIRRLGGRALFWPMVRIQSRFWYARDFPGRRAALAETFAYYREVMCPGFVRMYWEIAADQVATSLFGIAPQIAQPVLLLWGDQDDGAGMRAGVAKLRELLPHAELRVFRGVRHSIETEVPDDLARAIDEFVTRPFGRLP